MWLQGFLIWAVHRHAWFRRRALVDKMRLMLQDRVNNQLTVMLGMAEIRHREMTPAERQDMETATSAARTVAARAGDPVAGVAAALGAPLPVFPPRQLA